MDVRFTPTRFGAGYDMREVDDFLDRCDQALSSGDDSVTAQSVLSMRFTATRFREGYDIDEVDTFLDDVLAPRFAAPAPGGGASQLTPQQNSPQPELASAVVHPDLHPAETRGGFLTRLFRGR